MLSEAHTFRAFVKFERSRRTHHRRRFSGNSLSDIVDAVYTGLQEHLSLEQLLVLLDLFEFLFDLLTIYLHLDVIALTPA